jgi:hypothetical protein
LKVGINVSEEYRASIFRAKLSSTIIHTASQPEIPPWTSTNQVKRNVKEKEKEKEAT